MVKMGAKYILLAGRNLPNSGVQQSIAKINADSASMVTAIQLDVSSFEECRKLIKEQILAMRFPGLRGVMHAAGTLHDGLIENQSWDTFATTFKAKIEGTMHLHELTKHNSKLEHFVLFSSIASVFGAPAQSNHSAANHFEDVVAHYRNSMGLPATTINWGQWGEVGIATEAVFPGMKPLTNKQAMKALEYILKLSSVQTIVANIESFVLLSKLYPLISSMFDEHLSICATLVTTSGKLPSFDQEEFWQKYDELLSFSRKEELLKLRLRLIIKSILKLDEAEDVEDNANFQEMGVDSLMFVEMKNAIQTLLGNRVTISVNDLRDCNTIHLLSQVIISLIEETSAENPTKPPTMEQVALLVAEDCILPDKIKPCPDQHEVRTENISTILLTGVTGTLGPYLLRELSRNAQVKHIICLMRSKDSTIEEERLSRILKDRDLILEVDMNKVRCVTGNVAYPQLGMEIEVWNELVETVDAVLHCAARVSHVEFYEKRSSYNSIRSVNVRGLINVLEFCCAGKKLKHVYNTSSLLAGVSVDEKGNWSENWPEPHELDGITCLGYPVSKFVCDILAKEAITKRSIPGKVFRLPFISGDSKTGRFVLEQNHIMLRYIFYLKTGAMVCNNLPLPVFPVDICARIYVDIILNPNAPDDIYNVINSNPENEEKFVEIAKRLGYEIKVMAFTEFSKLVLEEGSGPLNIFKDFYNEDDYLMLGRNAPVLKAWKLDGKTKQDFFKSTKIDKYVPGFYETAAGRSSTMEFWYKDLQFAKENGWLKQFGL